MACSLDAAFGSSDASFFLLLGLDHRTTWEERREAREESGGARGGEGTAISG